MKEHRSDTGKRKKTLKSLASTPCVINSNTIRKSTQRRASNNVLTVEMLQQNQNKRKTTQNIFFKEKKKRGEDKKKKKKEKIERQLERWWMMKRQTSISLSLSFPPSAFVVSGCRPWNRTFWLPGKSGNRSGRRKKKNEIEELDLIWSA